MCFRGNNNNEVKASHPSWSAKMETGSRLSWNLLMKIHERKPHES